jgi:hypothetical protein
MTFLENCTTIRQLFTILIERADSIGFGMNIAMALRLIDDTPAYGYGMSCGWFVLHRTFQGFLT